MTVFDLYDMHCHLVFLPMLERRAIAMRQEGIGGMCATVTPDEYHLASLALADELQSKFQLQTRCRLAPVVAFRRFVRRRCD